MQKNREQVCDLERRFKFSLPISLCADGEMENEPSVRLDIE